LLIIEPDESDGIGGNQRREQAGADMLRRLA